MSLYSWHSTSSSEGVLLVLVHLCRRLALADGLHLFDVLQPLAEAMSSDRSTNSSERSTQGGGEAVEAQETAVKRQRSSKGNDVVTEAVNHTTICCPRHASRGNTRQKHCPSHDGSGNSRQKGAALPPQCSRSSRGSGSKSRPSRLREHGRNHRRGSILCAPPSDVGRRVQQKRGGRDSASGKAAQRLVRLHLAECGRDVVGGPRVRPAEDPRVVQALRGAVVGQ